MTPDFHDNARAEDDTLENFPARSRSAILINLLSTDITRLKFSGSPIIVTRMIFFYANMSRYSEINPNYQQKKGERYEGKRDTWKSKTNLLSSHFASSIKLAWGAFRLWIVWVFTWEKKKVLAHISKVFGAKRDF